MSPKSPMRNVIPGFIAALTLIFTAIVYPKLPPELPTHWGLNGQPDDYSSRAFGAWLLPGIMVAVWLLMRVLPRIDPKSENYARFQGTYSAIITTVVAMMGLLHVIVLGNSLGWNIPIPQVMPMVIGVFFIVLGNLLPRARPNWFVGIRTPWTLSNDRVWERTHRLGGVTFVIAGIIMVVAALLIPDRVSVAIIAAIILGAVVPVVYSFVTWMRIRKQS